MRIFGLIASCESIIFQVENKSLDARKKTDIFWLVQVAVNSPEIKGEEQPVFEILQIPFKKRKEQIVVVGSGPAGFFAAFVLQKAGFNVTLIERGSEVSKRGKSIQILNAPEYLMLKIITLLEKVEPELFLTGNSLHVQNIFHLKNSSYSAVMLRRVRPAKLCIWHIHTWGLTI